MKKLLLSICILSGLASFAQKDASLRIILPVADKEINSGKPFQVAFSVKNEGMDTITSLDTFSIASGIIVQGGQLAFPTMVGSVKLGPGDSIILGPQGGGYSFTFEEDIEPALFCVVLSFKDTTVDTNTVNDGDCQSIVLKVNTTAVSELLALANSVKAFPNPANTYFTITMKSSDASIEVMDITGKLVSTSPVTMGEARFDVSNYNNGVYFYQVKDASGSLVKSGKFTVSH